MKIETCEGKLDKAWVSGIEKHLKAKKTCALNSDALKENDKREILLKLRGLLDKRKLVIPEKYQALIENLLQYEYKKSPNGYVLGLALAVNLSTPR